MAKILLAILALTLLVGIEAQETMWDFLSDILGAERRVGEKCNVHIQCQYRICAPSKNFGPKICQPPNYSDNLRSFSGY
ncbi:hypothetical protein KQX54_012149 [Cotesia glomerata]|uniref:Uncharacterized protein n=1 Tax=Cotesia glomerata TaxID=32391 RepID=A0AAV7IP79_COTGL|nr:hypothetical protein KQX54_012149 [Cotesia glomerata]